MHERRLAVTLLAAVAPLASACATDANTIVFGPSGADAGDAFTGARPDAGADVSHKLTSDGGLRASDAATTGCATGSLDLVGCACPTPGAMQPCYTGPAGSEDKGTCRAGAQTCMAAGEFASWGACSGSVVPATEDCAGSKDTNCNGLVGCDDPTCTGLTGCCMSGSTRACYDGAAGTLGVGQCHGGSQVCDATGAWQACAGEVTPGQEGGHCGDDVDNDCNGLVDCKDSACFLDPHCLFGCTPGTSVACYAGPSKTEGVGPCKAGMKSCMANGNGYGPCMGAVVPVREGGHCDDGIDNDCNGFTDCADAVCETAPNCCKPSSGPAVDGTIWANSPDTLYRVDPSTFALTTVGSFGFSDQMTDIALTSSGNLYGISFTTLYSVDKATGAATPIASIPGLGNNSLAFLGGGDLLAADGTGDVKSINPATGQTTDIGDYGDGLIAAGDLVAVASGTMYGVSSTNAGGGDATNDNVLLRVDPSTGIGTPVGPMGYPAVWGFAYSNARVIAFTNGGQILQIDPQTGGSTVISQNNVMFWGATQSPLVPANACP